jgi:hypothetical protein
MISDVMDGFCRHWERISRPMKPLVPVEDELHV